MANVHRDFHGALSFGLDFLERHHGREGREDFLEGLADTVYAPLVAALERDGLPALEAHWKRIFGLEEGDVRITYEGDTLVLDVRSCPALAHLRARGYMIAEHFCAHTAVINAAICARAGYKSTCESDQAAGRCIQRFWKETEDTA